MLRLINILEANNIVTCTCLRNGDSKDAFSMKIDLEKRTIIEMDAEPSIYSRQALWKILKLSEQGRLPSEATSHWY